MKMKRKYIVVTMCIGVLLSSLSLQNVLVYATDDIQTTQEVDKKEVSEEENQKEDVIVEELKEVEEEIEAVDPTVFIEDTKELSASEKTAIPKNEIKNRAALPRAAGTPFKVANADGVMIQYYTPDSTVLEVHVGVPYDEYGQAVDTSYTGEVNIPDKVTYNGTTYAVTGIASGQQNGAFKRSSASKIIMPDSIKTIGEYAFDDSKMTNPPNLKNVVSIGRHAFKDTTRIVGPIYITKAMTLIGEEAFKRSAVKTFYLDYNGNTPWSTSVNYPFDRDNNMIGALIVKDYATYKEIATYDSRATSTLAYEVDIVFRDRNGIKIDSIDSHKALYGKPLFCQKQADNTWEMDKTKINNIYTTPTIPEEYKAEYDVWSPSILGGATFEAGKIDYYPQVWKQTNIYNTYNATIGGDIGDKDATTMGVYLASSKPYGINDLSRTFDDAFVKPEFDNLDTRYISKGADKQGNLLTLYSKDKAATAGPSIQYNWATNIKFKNVAESGTYYYYPIQQCFGKEYPNSNMNWQAEEARGTMKSFKVDIKPATIVINPPEKMYVGVKGGAYLLPDLNTILGKEGDTQGTYTWVSLTPPTSKGTYEYSYKFVPNNLTAASPFTGVNVDNYTEKEKTGTVTLVYTDPKEIEGIELNKKSVKMEVGASETLTTKFIEENATGDRSITWTSSDETVATVNKYGRITSIALGETKITATTTNGKKATCTVNVIIPIPIEKVTLDVEEMKLVVGRDRILNTTIMPLDTTDDKKISWTSSDESMATVDTTGKVVAKKAGTVTITATTINGKTATCKVTVIIPIPIEKVTLDRQEIKLDVGDARILNTTIMPLDTTDDKKITWTSSDEAMVTVDATGKVVAKKAGTVTITVTTTNGKTAVCKVVVVPATTIPEDVETYPDPDDSSTEIKDKIDEILATKKKYETLPDESKKEIKYDIIEKLNELLRNFDEIETNVVVKTPNDIKNASAKNLAEALDKDDIDKIINGSHTANVELVMENIVKGKVDAKELALFKEKQLDWEVASFININLVKTMIEVGATSTTTKTDIFEVAQPIKIKLDIPENIRGKSEYAVLRHHEGVVTELKDEDTDPNTITFFTDKFSTYNIVYRDNDIHNVVFDFMGGMFKGQSNPNFVTTAMQNSVITTYPYKDSITKQGYIFAGWYIDKEYTKEWNFEQDKVTSPMTLYAKWDIENGVPNLKPSEPTTTEKDKVETGDSAMLWPYYSLIVVSGLVLFLVVKKKETK